jgi:hypothetical protein
VDQKLFLKVALPLLLVGLILALFFLVGTWVAGSSRAPEPTVPAPQQAAFAPATAALDPSLVVITPSDAPANPLLDKMLLVKAELDKATRSMSGATKKNHGGYVERAQAELKQAAADLDAAIDFARQHPELVSVPGAAPADTFATVEHLKGLGIPKPNNQGHLDGGISGLQSALAALQEVKGGDLGGHRQTLIADFDRAGTTIFQGYQFLANGGKEANQAPATRPQGADPAALP